jgi:hypothetical protein
MKRLPKGVPLLEMVRDGGPNSLYDVDWSRNTLRMFEDSSVWKRTEVKCLNHKGAKAVRRVPWRRFERVDGPIVEYVRERVAEGYRMVKP